MQLLLKAIVSGIVVALASEAAKRSTLLGAVLVSLPLTSILTLTWLYSDTHNTDEVASLSWSILWVVLPSVVFFIALPLALNAGASFPLALLAACATTAVAYTAWIALARALSLDL